MEWKTLATLALGLTAASVGALLPQTTTICAAVAGACLGAVFPAVRTWGGNPQSRADDTPQAMTEPTSITKPIHKL